MDNPINSSSDNIDKSVNGAQSEVNRLCTEALDYLFQGYPNSSTTKPESNSKVTENSQSSPQAGGDIKPDVSREANPPLISDGPPKFPGLHGRGDGPPGFHGKLAPQGALENSKGHEQLIPRNNNNHLEHKAVRADRDRLQQSTDPAAMSKRLPKEHAPERPNANLKPKLNDLRILPDLIITGLA